MSDFKIIETQEQLDAIIVDRIRRAKESEAKKFEGWKSPEDIEELTKELTGKVKALEDAAAETQKQIEEKDQKIAEGNKYRTDLEKTRIALKAGLDIKYADRLRGENTEDWEADAKELAKDFAAAAKAVPVGSYEPSKTGERANADVFADWFAANTQ